MESNSFPMCVHLSEAAYEDAHRPANFEPMGTRQIKGKGKMDTYLYKVCPVFRKKRKKMQKMQKHAGVCLDSNL